MVKRKRGRPKSETGPQEWFQVRLPKVYQAKLQEHKEHTGCPYTEAVRRALDAYLKANGVEPPVVPT